METGPPPTFQKQKRRFDALRRRLHGQLRACLAGVHDAYQWWLVVINSESHSDFDS